MKPSTLSRDLIFRLLFTALLALVFAPPGFALTHAARTNLSWSYAPDMTRHGDAAYVATGETGIKVLDITDPTAPQLVGTVADGDTVYHVVARDEHLFASDHHGQWTIYNLAQPYHPQPLGSLEFSRHPTFFTLSGDIAAVGLNTASSYWKANRVSLVNIADAGNPRLLATLDFHDDVSDLAIEGNYLYVGFFSLRQLWIYNISEPSTPILAATIDSIRTSDIEIGQGILYTRFNFDDISVYSLEDPTDPALLCNWTNPFDEMSSDLQLIGTNLYILGGSLVKVDVSDPANPVGVDAIDWFPGFTECLIEKDGTLLMGLDDGYFSFSDPIVPTLGWITIIDNTDPSQLIEGATFFNPGQATCVVIDSSYAYVSMDEFRTRTHSSIRVYDTSWPAHPVQIGEYTTMKHPTDMVVIGDMLYAAVEDSGLFCIDISDPSTPERVGFLSLGDVSDPKLQVFGDYLCITSNHLTTLFDLTDPSAPVADVTLEGNLIAVEGDYAYLADDANNLRIFDLSDIQSPEQLGAWTQPDWSPYRGLVSNGLVAVIQCYFTLDGNVYTGVQLVDATDPTAPIAVGSIYTPVYRAVFAGDTLYTASLLNGLEAWDVSDPDSPALLARHPSRGLAMDVATYGDLLYAVSSHDLDVYSFTELGVDEPHRPGLPTRFAVSPAWPNPFNASTTVTVQVAQPGEVTFELFDVLGRRVRCDALMLGAGEQRWVLPGSDLSSGTYFLRVRGPQGGLAVRKVSLVR